MAIERNHLKKIKDNLYEIPKTYRSDMRVPARIYVNKKMFSQIFRDKSLEQLINVTTLPGIQKYALAMPDIHEGYGFPIGGVAAIDYENGVISPGGIGFDINCLTGKTRILHSFGYWTKIKDLESEWQESSVKSINFNRGAIDASLLSFQRFKPKNKVYRIKTLSGLTIEATEDHPFFTSERKMMSLKKLKVNSKIAVYPFEGVKYEKPNKSIIVSKKDIEKLKIEGNKKQIISELTSRGLLPLKTDNEKLPFLLKLYGFILGDGTINFIGQKKKGIIWFYGNPEDLSEIRNDIIKLGYKPSKIYSRSRKH
ncbi:RtcB family protein, partial [bacterium]|nr:RtcB family protein [bacterium]